MNINEINYARLNDMNLHDVILCTDGEIMKVHYGWIYTLNRRTEHGRLVHLAPVFVPRRSKNE